MQNKQSAKLANLGRLTTVRRSNKSAGLKTHGLDQAWLLRLVHPVFDAPLNTPENEWIKFAVALWEIETDETVDMETFASVTLSDSSLQLFPLIWGIWFWISIIYKKIRWE